MSLSTCNGFKAFPPRPGRHQICQDYASLGTPQNDILVEQDLTVAAAKVGPLNWDVAGLPKLRKTWPIAFWSFASPCYCESTSPTRRFMQRIPARILEKTGHTTTATPHASHKSSDSVPTKRFPKAPGAWSLPCCCMACEPGCTSRN